MNAFIDILLATYNGERFLKEQIDSILSQSYQNFHIIIRDDGSTDGTLDIIGKAVFINPDKISFLKDCSHVGAIESFSRLLCKSKSSFVMFADQDDIWMADKVLITLTKMKEMESIFGTEKALLVHSDLKVVDEYLQEISPSFWSYTGLKPREGTHLNRLLVQNEITGCTVMINRPLIELSRPIFPGCVMHDWWLGLVASACGHIGVIKEPLILYRQHGGNTLGAQKFGISLLLRKYSHKEKMKRLKLRHKKRIQAFAFLERFEGIISISNTQMILDYLSMKDTSILRNRYLLLKHRFFKQGLLRNLYNLFLVRVP